MNIMQQQFLHGSPDIPELRKVVSAAIKHSNGNIICSPRHFDTLCRAQIKQQVDQEGWLEAEQGFVDQFGAFMDRKEALKVAILQSQITRPEAVINDELFSEALY